MKNSLFLLLLFLAQFSTGQTTEDYSRIDKIMDQIPNSSTTSTDGIVGYINSNFTTESEKIRAVFYWTANNISYDVDSMDQPKPQTKAEKISSALKTRKGVCMHYSEVFSDVANKLGIKTVVISGYTKQAGKIARLSHAWNVSKMDGKWYLFDVTWGAGYIKDMVFYKKLNNGFFKSNSADFLKTHMPYDYMWQLNKRPISNDDFYKDIFESDLIANSYDFNAEIAQFETLSEPEKIQKRMLRIEQAGLRNDFVKTEYNLLKKNFDNHKNNNTIPTLELIVSEYNQANKLLTDFINYRNKRFMPLVSDEEIKNKVQVPYDKWLFCQEELGKIVNVSKENLANFNSLKKVVATSQKRFQEQLDFVNSYLSKSPSERTATFLSKRK
jgi:hypothetical protein